MRPLVTRWAEIDDVLEGPFPAPAPWESVMGVASVAAPAAAALAVGVRPRFDRGPHDAHDLPLGSALPGLEPLARHGFRLGEAGHLRYRPKPLITAPSDSRIGSTNPCSSHR